jgi:hypothetical protein
MGHIEKRDRDKGTVYRVRVASHLWCKSDTDVGS